ncbi:MAG: TadE/TadG family type IV pilus assembly protein [Maricaulaceae bacterium]
MRLFTNYLFKTYDRYKKNAQGATALEFGILCVPFFMLMFSIIELGITFLISTTMNHAMTDSARQIRTGQFQQTCGTGEEFKALVCEKMGSLGNCEARLRLDVVTSPSGDFEPDMLPDSPPPEPDPNDPDDPGLPPNTYVNTPARAVVVVRAEYYHPLSLPGTYTRLANMPGNTRLISATTAFRNEPFPGGC